MSIKKYIWAGALALLVAAPASAANVTREINFTASGFAGFGSPAPVDPVVGSFDITFDSAVNHPDTTSGIVLNNLNISLGSALAFSYSASLDILQIGGTANNVSSIQHNIATDDFFLRISNFLSATPVFDSFLYVQSAYNNSLWQAGSVSGTVVDPNASAAVPIPGAAALLLSALGGLGLFGLSRRRREEALA